MELEMCGCDVNDAMRQGWVGLKEDLVAVSLDNRMRRQSPSVTLSEVEVETMIPTRICDVCLAPIVTVKYRLKGTPLSVVLLRALRLRRE